MSPNRNDQNGFLAINKPIGLTSFKVVEKVKKHLKIKKVGHTGTLDPRASGVLILALGYATKTLNFMPDSPKSYEVEMSLGFSSNTEDIEGDIFGAEPEKYPGIDEFKTVLESFLGKQKQVPPQFSAIKISGKPAYKYARAGQVIQIPEREIEIFSFHNINLNEGPKVIEVSQKNNPIKKLTFKKYFTFEVSCSKGTYIRSLVRDIGQRLHIPALLIGLKRTLSDAFYLRDSTELNALLVEEKNPDIISIFDFFQPYLAQFFFPDHFEKVIFNGGFIPATDLDLPVEDEQIFLLKNSRYNLFAFYKKDGQKLKAMKVIHP
ncbi:tRNA pseudouridine(55) synthase TruB [Candidatus Riflebacteria bacterium]